MPGGADLSAVMGSNPAGTTYCLLAGTFDVDSTISTEVGDRVIGAGADATFIVGSGLPPTSPGIFETNDDNYFASFDISGAPTPVPGSGVFCGSGPSPSRSDCGKAFSVGGSPLRVESVDCHDNGGSCIGGGGSANVTVVGLDCWGNGDAYSMDPRFAFAACIKRVAAYEPGNDTVVRDSLIHDNAAVGIWCDFCKYGFFDIEGNRIVHNGANGIQWEMSGGWTSSDRALIKDNVIRSNNYRNDPIRGGVGISTANDITVESNDFGGNGTAGVSIIFSVGRNPPQSDSIGVLVRDNTMNGDAILGCGGISLIKRLFQLRVPVGLGLFALAAILFVGLGVPARRSLLFGFGGVLAGAMVLGLLVVLSRHAGATCINNV